MVAAVVVTVPLMLMVLFARTLGAATDWRWLTVIGQLAFPWYVVVGTMIALIAGLVSAQFVVTAPSQEQLT